MNPSYYATFLPLIFLLIFIFYQERQSRICARRIINNGKKKTGDTEMLTLAKTMVGKECLIYTFNGTQITGVIAEVSDGAIRVDREKESEIVNLDFVVRIREFPRKKNGKKKSVVLD